MTLQLECTSCTHFQTCIIFRAFNQTIQQHFKQDNTPILPQKIATICNQYLNNTAITYYKNLTNEQEEQTHEN